MGKRLSDYERWMRSQLEHDVQETLRKQALAFGFPYHHETDSRKSPEGFPDTVIPVPPVLWVIECKKEMGKLEPAQERWAEGVQACTEVEYRIARPSNVASIVEEILGRWQR